MKNFKVILTENTELIGKVKEVKKDLFLIEIVAIDSNGLLSTNQIWVDKREMERSHEVA